MQPFASRLLLHHGAHEFILVPHPVALFVLPVPVFTIAENGFWNCAEN
jgi:hypothetical protein